MIEQEKEPKTESVEKTPQSEKMIRIIKENIGAKIEGIPEEHRAERSSWEGLSRMISEKSAAVLSSNRNTANQIYHELFVERTTSNSDIKIADWIALTIADINVAEKLKESPGQKIYSSCGFTERAVTEGNVAIDLHVIDGLRESDVKKIMVVLGVNEEKDELKPGDPLFEAYYRNVKMPEGGKIWAHEIWDKDIMEKIRENNLGRADREKRKWYKTKVPGLVFEIKKDFGKGKDVLVAMGYYAFQDRLETMQEQIKK